MNERTHAKTVYEQCKDDRRLYEHMHSWFVDGLVSQTTDAEDERPGLITRTKASMHCRTYVCMGRRSLPIIRTSNYICSSPDFIRAVHPVIRRQGSIDDGGRAVAGQHSARAETAPWKACMATCTPCFCLLASPAGLAAFFHEHLRLYTGSKYPSRSASSFPLNFCRAAGRMPN